MFSPYVEGYDTNFASIRKKGNDVLFYRILRMGDKISLHSTYLPVSPSIRNYHIKPLGTRQGNFDENWLIASVVDENKKVRIFLNRINTRTGKQKLEELSLRGGENSSCNRGFVGGLYGATSDYIIFFVGEYEDGKVRVNGIEGIETLDMSSLYHADKGSVRFNISQTHRSLLFYLSNGEPRLYFAGEEEANKVENKINEDLLITSASEHIQILTPYNKIIVPGDNCLYHMRVVYSKYSGSKSVSIYLSENYPPNVKAEDIHKIMIKKTSNNDYAYLLLTKNGDLWGKGDNTDGMLGDHDGKDWKVTFKDVEDIHPINDLSLGFFIKTRDKKLYYKGLRSKKTPSISNFLYLPPYIKKDVFPNTNLVAENIDTVIAIITYSDEKDPNLEHCYSYFLDTNGNYLKGYVNSQGRNDNVLKVWLGDLKKMQDVFFDSLKRPFLLMDYACKLD